MASLSGVDSSSVTNRPRKIFSGADMPGAGCPQALSNSIARTEVRQPRHTRLSLSCIIVRSSRRYHSGSLVLYCLKSSRRAPRSFPFSPLALNRAAFAGNSQISIADRRGRRNSGLPGLENWYKKGLYCRKSGLVGAINTELKSVHPDSRIPCRTAGEIRIPLLFKHFSGAGRVGSRLPTDYYLRGDRKLYGLHDN